MPPSPLPDFPSLDIERALWANGALWVAGVDEAGRGALAGPVTAAAIILPQISVLIKELQGVRDSKKMSVAQRESWSPIIKSNAVTFGIGWASSQEIDSLGILPATKLAAQRAIKQLSVVPDHVMIDHFRLFDLVIPQTSISKGDAISLTIAAASVLAKTTRDALLREFDMHYPGYGFSDHKGYGTAAHLDAIRNLGPTPIHRLSFAPLKDMGTQE
ncbi:ribonuclease HII [Chloroflexota bacterium]